MARKQRQKVTEDQVTGLKHFKRLTPLFERLRGVGCERDKAGNRDLHFDQLSGLYLLFIFNPVLSSLRGLQQASELKKVQRKLGCKRASLGSLSEAAHVFDADALKQVVAELGDQLEPLVQDERLEQVPHLIEIVDGTLLKALPQVVEAMWYSKSGKDKYHDWRLHTHFSVTRAVPTKVAVTNGSNRDEANEKAVLGETMEPDHCYVMDRGYGKYQLFNAIHEIGSSYVCRWKDKGRFPVLEDRALTDEAKAEKVISDQLVEMGQGLKADNRPDHPMRLVCVQTRPHRKRPDAGARGGPGSDGIIRILTNLTEVPAEVIAVLYQHRWDIEVFFRFFKHILGCRHLLSQSSNGIRIQTYCAMIACMLIALYTGRKPTLRTFEMICHFFTGLADEEELLAHIARLQPQP